MVSRLESELDILKASLPNEASELEKRVSTAFQLRHRATALHYIGALRLGSLLRGFIVDGWRSNFRLEISKIKESSEARSEEALETLKREHQEVPGEAPR